MQWGQARARSGGAHLLAGRPGMADDCPICPLPGGRSGRRGGAIGKSPHYPPVGEGGEAPGRGRREAWERRDADHSKLGPTPSSTMAGRGEASDPRALKNTWARFTPLVNSRFARWPPFLETPPTPRAFGTLIGSSGPGHFHSSVGPQRLIYPDLAPRAAMDDEGGRLLHHGTGVGPGPWGFAPPPKHKTSKMFLDLYSLVDGVSDEVRRALYAGSLAHDFCRPLGSSCYCSMGLTSPLLVHFSQALVMILFTWGSPLPFLFTSRSSSWFCSRGAHLSPSCSPLAGARHGFVHVLLRLRSHAHGLHATPIAHLPNLTRRFGSYDGNDF